MGIYWEPVEVGMALLGGAFIALATTLNILLMGRITGMSGMFFTLIRLKQSEGLIWKISALAGLVLVPFLFFYGESKHIDINGYSYRVLDDQYEATHDLSLAGWAVGGLLVGFGTKLGNGCTSGHGVCGLPRLSLRSFVAVGLFMGTAVAIATLRLYEPFLNADDWANDTFVETYNHVAQAVMGILLLTALVLMVYNFLTKTSTGDKYDPFISFFIGGIFGIGLLLSGMCRRTKIRNFLSLGDGWDPSLMFVMVSAVSINFVTFHFMLDNPKVPLLMPECQLPKKKTIDWQVVVGPMIFGLGWGISGFCPGPALVNLFLITHCGLFIVALAVGQLLAYALTLVTDKPAAKPADNKHELSLGTK